MTREELIAKWKKEQAEKMQSLAKASELYDEQEKPQLIDMTQDRAVWRRSALMQRNSFLNFCDANNVSAIELYFFRKKQGKIVPSIVGFETRVKWRLYGGQRSSNKKDKQIPPK